MTLHVLGYDAANSKVELFPGDVAVGVAGKQMYTLLGSCIAVILTDPKRTIGAMCHIVHVRTPPVAERANTAYGEVAMARMFRELSSRGFAPNRCQAFVYGGGNMFPSLNLKAAVGDRNGEWVMDFLTHAGIEIVESSLRGVGYRTVHWTVGEDWPLVQQSGGVE